MNHSIIFRRYQLIEIPMYCIFAFMIQYIFIYSILPLLMLTFCQLHLLNCHLAILLDRFDPEGQIKNKNYPNINKQ